MAKKYTVIGIYEDNHQPWATFVPGKSPTDAAIKGVEEMVRINEPVDDEDAEYIQSNLLVLSVISGHHPDLLSSEGLLRVVEGKLVDADVTCG